MNRRRKGRVLFGLGFVVLLIDGAAAIWLGQVSGRASLIVVGVMLVFAALAVIWAWHRWQEALDAVDVARAELKMEIGRLRQAADQARGRTPDA